MFEIIARERYLNRLVRMKDDGDIKIITGPRRSGKSWLLDKIYRRYLRSQGVKDSHIISINFDSDDDKFDFDILDVKEVKKYLYKHIVEDSNYYIFLDEIQELDGFERLVNGLNSHENIDIYVTGSNSRFLSSDIKTIFRGRGEEIEVFPLDFSEYIVTSDETLEVKWREYMRYGGMPRLIHYFDEEQKVSYLQRLWNKTYIDDVVERNRIRNPLALDLISTNLCSSVSSLTNPHKIANTLESAQHIKINSETVAAYIKYLEDAYLFKGVQRYDIKGKRYFESLKKYYCIDVGLRNAKLDFRQQEPTHLMENIIFNHLRFLGYLVDVGIVENREMINGKSTYSRREIDFVATKNGRRYYIQSAFAIPDENKMNQELESLRKIRDSFKKIVVRGENMSPYINEEGIFFINIFDFLLTEEWE